MNLSALNAITLTRGIEKEGLRMTKDGYSAKTPHPAALGSKLTHPFITTDYSENLLELITPPYDSIDQALAMLTRLHIAVSRTLGEEIMWPLSMPCMLSDDDADIPLADFGSSNIGKLKTLYRSGLGVRYGRKMQTIAGLHYNLSISDDTWQNLYDNSDKAMDFFAFKNSQYLALIRNFKRLSVLILYLTGASPSVCACFVADRPHNLIALDKNTLHAPYATSLRMGKLGYTNSVQKDLQIFYNNLEDYATSLKRAVFTPFDRFSQIGIDDQEGNPIQINDHILQIENEYYSPIRPKQITKSGETPTDALKARGIAYVEFRAIDLDPYSPIGISSQTAHFLEIVAVYCLLSPSENLYLAEEHEIAQNTDTIVNFGRADGVQITQNGVLVDFKDWAKNHLDKMQEIADLLDKSYYQNTNNHHYKNALRLMQNRLSDSTQTVSAQIIKDSQTLGSTWHLGAKLGQQHKEHLLSLPFDKEDIAYFEHLATQSITEQHLLEKNETMDFGEFIKPYRNL